MEVEVIIHDILIQIDAYLNHRLVKHSGFQVACCDRFLFPGGKRLKMSCKSHSGLFQVSKKEVSV